MGIETCVGHLTKNQSPEGWCVRCVSDKKNKDCPYYFPVPLYTFTVRSRYEFKAVHRQLHLFEEEYK